jgi:hypothetical protein
MNSTTVIDPAAVDLPSTVSIDITALLHGTTHYRRLATWASGVCRKPSASARIHGRLFAGAPGMASNPDSSAGWHSAHRLVTCVTWER